MVKHRVTGRWRLGLALTLLTAFMWGWLTIALKIALEQMDSVTIAWYRFFGASLCLGVWLAWGRRLGVYAGLGGKTRRLLLLAALGLAGNYCLYIYGLSFIMPSAAQLIIQCAPILVSLGAIHLFEERFSARQWFGLALVVAGFGLYFRDQVLLLAGQFAAFSFGAAMVFLSAVAWAAYALAQKQLLTELRPIEIMFSLYALSILVFAPFARLSAILTLDRLHLAMLGLASLNTVIAYGAFSEALAHWDASRIGAVLSVTPLFTLVMMNAVSRLWPSVLGPEPISIAGMLGAVVIVGGAMLCAQGKAPARIKVLAR